MKFPLLCILAAAIMLPAVAQSGNSGTIRGTVADPTGAVIPNATVSLLNNASGLHRTATTDATGKFALENIPFGSYKATFTATGFKSASENVELHSAIGSSINIALAIGAETETVEVQASGPEIDTDSTFHTDVDRDLFIKVPLESQSSGLSSLVTLTTPGVSADSNGLFHGLGDHASNSFSVDGQSITDQQSKVFSNQLPDQAVQSIQVISGAPPAEYGGKTSLVIVATTRSGQGIATPTGSLYSSYGSFGSAAAGFDLSYGSKQWGNFIESDGLNSGRFLDPPEFAVMHDKGNEENFFDRADWQWNTANSIHTDFNYSRSWFQTPNSYDATNVQNVINGGTSPSPTFGNVGNADQRSQIETYNFAPVFTRIISNNAVWNLGGFMRHDNYHYYPSGNPLADLGPANLQTSSISQQRTLTNTGVHSDLEYSRGIHTAKFGAQYEQTFLNENDSLGVASPFYNAPCLDAAGNPIAGYSNPAQCAFPNPGYLAVLAPYDLTRAGAFYAFAGHTDVKELALYAEDQIKVSNWNFNIGLREDKYNGLTTASQLQPRLGIAYDVKQTGTVLRISYARTLETPFNENLVLSSRGCADPVLAPLLNCTAGVSSILNPGYKNEFHAGLQQGFGPHLILSGEYIWKYTHNAFDFSVLGNTPITFPIDWHNSKIPGYALHLDVPSYHNFTAYTVMSSVAARFFPPQVAGAGATVGHTGLPFRIDHDEKFNQTTHLQYTISRGKLTNGLWAGGNWRFDSGQVAGQAPCYNPLSNDPNSACATTSILLGGLPAILLSSLTADEEFQAGLTCNGQRATPGNPLPAECLATQFGSTLLRIPAPGIGDNDKNPPRTAPRNLFDVTLGKNNLFNAQRYKLDLDLTAINLTNNYTLYNFLSTFSGTHYVTPRAVTAKMTLNF